MTPTVTVLTPAYNAEKYIAQTIKSVLAQTFTDFEYIIVNDCSTDNTEAVIKSFDDPRIRLINNKKNLKIAESLDVGLVNARGKYIARIDADDLMAVDRLAKQVEVMDADDSIVLCGTFMIIIDEKGKEIDRWSIPVSYDEIHCLLYFGNAMFHPSVIIRRSALADNDLLYDPNYVAEDYDLWAKLNEIGRIINIPEYVTYYRLHRNQVTQMNADGIDNSAREVALKSLQRWLGKDFDKDTVRIFLGYNSTILLKKAVELCRLIYNKSKVEHKFEATILKSILKSHIKTLYRKNLLVLESGDRLDVLLNITFYYKLLGGKYLFKILFRK